MDYDSIESMDVELVQEHIMALTQGLEVTTPVYNMKVLAFPPSRPPSRPFRLRARTRKDAHRPRGGGGGGGQGGGGDSWWQARRARARVAEREGRS